MVIYMISTTVQAEENEGVAGNEITVTNNSNVQVNAAFTYTLITGFDYIGGVFSGNSFTVPVGGSSIVALTITSKSETALSNNTMGTVTVTITSPYGDNF